MRFQRFGYSEISRTSRQPHTGRTDHNERNAGCPTHGTLLFLCLGWATIVPSTIPARIPTKLVILSAAKDPLSLLPLLLLFCLSFPSGNLLLLQPQPRANQTRDANLKPTKCQRRDAIPAQDSAPKARNATRAENTSNDT